MPSVRSSEPGLLHRRASEHIKARAYCHVDLRYPSAGSMTVGVAYYSSSDMFGASLMPLMMHHLIFINSGARTAQAGWMHVSYLAHLSMSSIRSSRGISGAKAPGQVYSVNVLCVREAAERMPSRCHHVAGRRGGNPARRHITQALDS